VVTDMEFNKMAILDLVDGRLLDLYEFILKTGTEKLAVSKRLAAGRVIEKAKKAGLDEEALRKFFNERGIKYATAMKTETTTDYAAKFFGSYMKIIEEGDDLTFTYKTKKSLIERMIIETLARAGWTNRQIHSATGFGLRRVQRISKKVREENDGLQ